MPSKNARAPWCTVRSLGDLKEVNELEPVESLGAGLVGVDLGQSGVDGWVGGDQAVDVREPEEASDAGRA